MIHAARPVMPPFKKRTIQGLYLASQFLSIGSAFAGSLLGIYDYTHPGVRRPENIQYLICVGFLAFAAAATGSLTAHKFQGQKIGAADEDHDAEPYHRYELAPQNWKSKTAEGSYLFFATTLSIANNYLLVAGLNAFLSSSKEPMLPPGSLGIMFFLFKSLCVDLLFDGCSATYEACEEIKKTFTTSKAGPLLSRLMRPIAVRPYPLKALILWLQIVGVTSHTGTDVLGFILSVPSLLSFIPGVPKIDTAHGFLKTPALMLPILLTSFVLFVFNYLQTLYFEAKESEFNLKKIRDIHSPFAAYPMLRNTEKANGIIRRLLLWAPPAKQVIRGGFYTQGPLHAFGDLMPIVLLLRDLYDRYEVNDSPWAIGVMVASSLLVFVGSCWGTHHSEVTTAIHHFDEDFQDIGSPLSHSHGR